MSSNLDLIQKIEKWAPEAEGYKVQRQELYEKLKSFCGDLYRDILVAITVYYMHLKKVDTDKSRLDLARKAKKEHDEWRKKELKKKKGRPKREPWLAYFYSELKNGKLILPSHRPMETMKGLFLLRLNELFNKVDRRRLRTNKKLTFNKYELISDILTYFFDVGLDKGSVADPDSVKKAISRYKKRLRLPIEKKI